MVPKAKKSTTFSTSKRNLVAAESHVHQRLSAVEQTGSGGAVVVHCEYLDLQCEYLDVQCECLDVQCEYLNVSSTLAVVQL